jgi:hypothetical protein
MDIIDYLQENSGWIRDMFTIFFTATGTLLAILTYRRARATILQPKRTEVIKKQTELLTSFLTLVSKHHNSIDTGLDYSSIFNYNVDLVLRDYGLIEIEKDSERYFELNNDIAGWIQFLENDFKEYVFIKGSLLDYDRLIFEKDDRDRQKFYASKALKGHIVVHRIFFTKKHEEFYKALRDFWNNPFLPTEIQKVSEEIGVDIFINLHQDLRTILKLLVEKYFDAILNEDSPNKLILLPEYRHQELYRVYEKERKQHRVSYDILKAKIRKHLEIDSKW